MRQFLNSFSSPREDGVSGHDLSGHDLSGNSLSLKDIVFSSLMFQAVWFDILVFQTGAAYVVLVTMVTHLLLVIRTGRFKVMLSLICLVLFGILLDSALTWAGVFQFDAPVGLLGIPAWLVQIWFAFILSLPIAFSWLLQNPLKSAVIFGLFAPLSYLAGRGFGVIEFSNSSVVLIGLVWFTFGLAASLLMSPRRQNVADKSLGQVV